MGQCPSSQMKNNCRGTEKNSKVLTQIPHRAES